MNEYFSPITHLFIRKHVFEMVVWHETNRRFQGVTCA